MNTKEYEEFHRIKTLYNKAVQKCLQDNNFTPEGYSSKEDYKELKELLKIK